MGFVLKDQEDAAISGYIAATTSRTAAAFSTEMMRLVDDRAMVTIDHSVG